MTAANNIESAISAKYAVMAVVGAAMCLLSLIAVYNVYDDWRLLQREDLKAVMSIAESCAEQQNARTTTMEILLRSIVLSANADRLNTGSFYNYLRSVDSLYPGHLKFVVLRTDGTQIKFPGDPTQFPLTPPIIVRDRFYFKEILKSKRFVIGERLNTPKLSSDSLVPMAMPILDKDRHVTAILVAIFDLSISESVFKILYKNYKTEIIFFDRNKTMAYRYPMFPNMAMGMPVANKKMLQAMEGKEDKVAFKDNDLFGNPKAFALVKLRMPLGKTPYMYVAAISPRMDLWQFISDQYLPQIAATVVSILLSMWLAARSGWHFFARGLEKMAIRLSRIKCGDMSGRLRNITGCREIRILAEGINSMLESIQESNAKLRKLSYSDELTGLFNRRHFCEMAVLEIKRSLRQGYPFSIIMADLDHFKTINDSYGHAGGDAVLRSFADSMRGNIRETDILARLGGEEFIILMPETSLDGAMAATEKLRQICSSAKIDLQDKTITYTASFGVYCHTPQSGRELPNSESPLEILEHVMKKADEALYMSKSSGRNQVKSC